MENGKQSAFSRPAFRDTDEAIKNHDDLSHDCEDGLTKREYFAAMAMQGMLAKESSVRQIASEAESPSSLLQTIASTSVKIADALLKELEK